MVSTSTGCGWAGLAWSVLVGVWVMGAPCGRVPGCRDPAWPRPGGRNPDQMVRCLLTGRQGTPRAPTMEEPTEEPMDRRIAQLALARFRVGGFVGTSIADLAGALGVSKAAIYYHYRSKDTLLHRLIDPLLDAIDACIQDHTTPARTPRQLLGAYLAVL